MWSNTMTRRYSPTMVHIATLTIVFILFKIVISTFQTHCKTTKIIVFHEIILCFSAFIARFLVIRLAYSLKMCNFGTW